MIFNDERATGANLPACLLHLPCTHVRSNCRICFYAVLVGTRWPLSVQLRPSTRAQDQPVLLVMPVCPVCLSVCLSQ